MKYLVQEDETKLHLLGSKILQMKRLKKEVTDFFVGPNGEANYHEAQDMLDVINNYINGESLDYIGELIYQSDKEPIEQILQLMGINTT